LDPKRGEEMESVDFLAQRRRRLIGTILGHMEVNVYSYLPPEVQQQLRTTVINAINSHHDSVLDIIHAYEDVLEE
jgi:hypothetical protein